ncbi:MAG: phosphatase PAP2 family protein [Planctomycetaceae bacterium]|nr:phosphatase PAP2 family protein [Planctomycetaceae bacterium]
MLRKVHQLGGWILLLAAATLVVNASGMLWAQEFDGWLSTLAAPEVPWLQVGEDVEPVVSVSNWEKPGYFDSFMGEMPMRLVQDGSPSFVSGPKDTFFDLGSDFRNLYSLETLQPFVIVTGAAALMANTNFDGSFDRHYESLRISPTNDFVGTVKSFGDGGRMLPIYGGAMVLHWIVPPDSVFAPVGDWGDRTMRAFVVGAPALVGMQLLTGGSRPEEGNSHWHPFNDNNGASGHAFMGALPFMAAAEMTDHRGVKLGLYTASALTGWSRVNDRDHYLSQVVLGWTIAYLATRSVSQTEGENGFQMIPIASPEFTGAIFQVRY